MATRHTRCQSEKSREEHFNKTLKEKEELEVKLENALDLQKQLAELKSSSDFMSDDDMDKLREETASKEKRFSKSLAFHQQLLQLKCAIVSIKNSKDYLDPMDEELIQYAIQMKKSKIERFVNVQREISQTERNPDFLTEISLDRMKEQLNLLNNILMAYNQINQRKKMKIFFIFLFFFYVMFLPLCFDLLF
jgi:hypothetical protein